MSPDIDTALREALLTAYDTPRDVPDLAVSVERRFRKRRVRRRAAGAVLAVLVVVAVAVSPALIRSISRPGPAAVASPAPGIAAAPALLGHWRLTSIYGKPAPAGLLAELVFLDAPAGGVLTAIVGNSTTRMSVRYGPVSLVLTGAYTSRVAVAPGESALRSSLVAALRGRVDWAVAGGRLTLRGADGSVMVLARNAPAAAASSPAGPASTVPAAVVPCAARDLSARFIHGGAGGGELLDGIEIRNASKTACRLAGAVAFSALDKGGVAIVGAKNDQLLKISAIMRPAPARAEGTQPAAGAYVEVRIAGEQRDYAQSQDQCRRQDLVTPATLVITIGRVVLDVPNLDAHSADGAARTSGCHGLIGARSVALS
ncbi:MAG: hypothetical protein QOF82_1717 [Frankiales bacterium]|nr:hypothetical protein [Frankiales bacterium]